MRVGEDLLGAAELHQVPIEEEPGIVADPGSLLHGVGDDDDSVIFLQAAEKLFHLEGGDGIKGGGKALAPETHRIQRW